MITIFTVPKPFTDPHIALIQRNAILSWRALHPKIDILLLGNEAGVVEFAKEHKLRHYPKIGLNKYGTPLVSSVFSEAQKHAHYLLMLYINADIIIFKDILGLLTHLPQQPFLIVGRRIDLKITSPILFSRPNWATRLKQRSVTQGHPHPSLGSDYFLFQKGTLPRMPRLTIGRIGWDNWLLYAAVKSGLRVIDASEINPVVHQNHNYQHQLGEGNAIETNPEATANLRFLTSSARHFTLHKLDYYFKGEIIKKRWPIRQIILGLILTSIVLIAAAIRFNNLSASARKIKQDFFTLSAYRTRQTYDQQMVELFGKSYLFFKFANQITPTNAIIYYPDTEDIPSDYRGIFAAYFMYPRHIQMSKQDGQLKNFLEYQRVNVKLPQYVTLMFGFPPFPLNTRRIYIYNQYLDNYQIIDNLKFTPGDKRFTNQLGLIEL